MKVELRHVSKHFANRDNKKEDIIAVNDFNFVIPDGKLVGLLGPSGCGKSTTLNLISGLLSPTSGNIIFGDEDVTNLAPEKRGIGLVFQNYALYPHMTVEENIMFPLGNIKKPNKLSKQEMQTKAKEVAKLVQIDELLNRKPKELSGGQQQRVAIARALVKMPKVLLLDEPLSNLDARLRLKTREEIRRIQQETGITTIFVTHDQDEAMSICDYVVVMKDGKVMQIAEPQKVYDNPQNLFVATFLGNPPINLLKARIKDCALYIADELISNNYPYNNQDVTVAIRPEAFIPSKDGILTCEYARVEVMGRDKSIISSHSDMLSPNIRAIVDNDINLDIIDNKIKFNLKMHKLFVFDNDGQRLNEVKHG